MWPSVLQSLHVVLSLNVFSCVSTFLLLVGQDGGLTMFLWLHSDSMALAALLPQPLRGFVYRCVPLHPAQILPLDKKSIKVHPQLTQSHLCPTETMSGTGGQGFTPEFGWSWIYQWRRGGGGAPPEAKGNLIFSEGHSPERCRSSCPQPVLPLPPSSSPFNNLSSPG